VAAASPAQGLPQLPTRLHTAREMRISDGADERQLTRMDELSSSVSETSQCFFVFFCCNVMIVVTTYVLGYFWLVIILFSLKV
jgi:hypothetical protein